MTHYSRLARIVIDAPGDTHDAEVAFWREASGIPLRRFERFPAFHGVRPGPDGIGLLTQHLGDGPAGVHLDIHTNDLAAEVARLVALGASVVDDSQLWTILRDPAGLLFCVVPDEQVNESNAHAWSG
jgi:hypothetical protein